MYLPVIRTTSNLYGKVLWGKHVLLYEGELTIVVTRTVGGVSFYGDFKKVALHILLNAMQRPRDHMQEVFNRVP